MKNLRIVFLLGLCILLAGCGRQAKDAAGQMAVYTEILPAEAENATSAQEEPEYEAYGFDAGLTVFLPAGMTVSELSGSDVFAYNESCMVNGIREDFATLKETVSDPENLTLEEYAAIVQQTNALEDVFIPDEYGNLYVTYVRESGNASFFYYTTVRKGSDAFWIVTFACQEAARETCLPEFVLWGSSIEVL